MDSRKLSADTFRCVIAHTPLVSIDLIVRHKTKILLGERVNEPAKGYWFTTGGRVFKNETIDEAQRRIAREELGLTSLPTKPEFLGVFEHFYETSPFSDVSTHYVNLGYLLDVKTPIIPPLEQHSRYRWFGIEELLRDPRVHQYVKIYFTKDEYGK